MRMSEDTDATSNTGNKTYHLWVIPQYPEMVVEYLQSGKNTEYDSVQLVAAFDLNILQQLDNHGQITIVI